MGKLAKLFVDEVYNDTLTDVADNNTNINLEYEQTPTTA